MQYKFLCGFFPHSKDSWTKRDRYGMINMETQGTLKIYRKDYLHCKVSNEPISLFSQI